ncbi:hypothetical protein FH608_032280 [Nonomuraea phyllanthi]|uniref:Uncharacterized protein n=1 Tax=Nonomuraea phyllanthi TaxID=2219224 RepID=A0A5C4VB82_9ACTN|nr:hypothetical protein [Nonomuraea phyllanthi]KAB8191266.1 hypothetical protein FH608_032280 [Nonomuraea phyllanthi]
MLVILAIAAIAILACVVLVSLGRGGELSEFPPDVPPLDLPEPGQLTAVDFMALQLPVNLVGYHTASVDETLRRAANAISARDTRIAVLEQRVSELLSSRLHARQEVYAAPGAGLRTDHAPEAPAVARELPESGDPVTSSGATISWDGTAELRHPPEDPEWRIPPSDGAVAPAAPSDGAAAPAVDPVVEEPAAVKPEPPALDPTDEEPAEAEAAVDASSGPEAPAEEQADAEPVAVEDPDETGRSDGEVRSGAADAVHAAPAKDGSERP